MSLPPLAPIPPANVRLALAPEEWIACLDAWLALGDMYAGIPGAKADTSNLTLFLTSFYHESSRAAANDETLRSAKAQLLQKTCFKLTQRTLLDGLDTADLLRWNFLADFCHTHIKSPALSRLMTRVWKERRPQLEKVLQEQKTTLTAELESITAATKLPSQLQSLAPLLRASPDAAAFFMVGSDFLDALVSSYSKTSAVVDRKSLALVLYLGLESLVKIEPQNVSLLSDHLYSLKASAEKANKSDTVLADLVTNTPLISRLRRLVTGKASDRLLKLLDSLDTFRTPSIARPRKRVSRKVDKSKGRATQADGDIHMHRMSLVTQVQDLFPDLGSGFVMTLLDEYNDDVEQVTAHLLDDSLPPHLASLDRAEAAPSFATTKAPDDLAPRSTPPPEPFIPTRRNVYDDDLADLSSSTGRLHIGKKPSNPDHDSAGPNKSAILSALAAFDADDDERDDTYDVDDVGGTIDTANPDGEIAPARQAEQQETLDSTLYPLYRANPQLFGRTFDVRRGQARQALKAETGLTDEAIEGWATMLAREGGRRVKALEERFAGPGAFDGRQAELGRSAYRQESGTEESDGGGDAGRGRGRGRVGRGRGGRGRGKGNVAGPSGDAGTAAAQRRKEENKGSRANHNRRDQRARKMARGGFAG